MLGLLFSPSLWGEGAGGEGDDLRFFRLRQLEDDAVPTGLTSMK